MRRDSSVAKVQVDGYTRVCLTAIAVLLTVVVAGLWADGSGLDRSAVAQEPVSRENRYIPSSVGQLSDMVALQRLTNEKLDLIIKLLESGQAKVQIAGGEESAPAQPESENGVIRITPEG